MSRHLRNHKGSQLGLALIELLVALIVLTIAIAIVGQYVTAAHRSAVIARTVNAHNLIAEQTAQILAKSQLPGPKHGVVILSEKGKVSVDPTEPIKGERFEYDAKVYKLSNSNCYVMVNLKSNQKTFVSAGRMYQLTP